MVYPVYLLIFSTHGSKISVLTITKVKQRDGLG